MIVLKPKYLLKMYADSYIAKQNQKRLQEFRQEFSMFEPSHYRGISRWPLMPYPSLDQQIIDLFRETGCEMDNNKRARVRFCEIIGDTPDDHDEDILPTLDDARAIYSLLDAPAKWEILELHRINFQVGDNTLGFDIGYWGGDHFSLIADIIVIPQWHPPISADFGEIKEKLRNLNQSLLFNNPSDAEVFRQYYKSKDWAETEDEEGEFCIIQVDEVIQRDS